MRSTPSTGFLQRAQLSGQLFQRQVTQPYTCPHFMIAPERTRVTHRMQSRVSGVPTGASGSAPSSDGRVGRSDDGGRFSGAIRGETDDISASSTGPDTEDISARSTTTYGLCKPSRAIVGPMRLITGNRDEIGDRGVGCRGVRSGVESSVNSEDVTSQLAVSSRRRESVDIVALLTCVPDDSADEEDAPDRRRIRSELMDCKTRSSIAPPGR